MNGDRLSKETADDIKRLAHLAIGGNGPGWPTWDAFAARIDSLTVESRPIASLEDVAALSLAAAEAKFGPAFARPVEHPRCGGDGCPGCRWCSVEPPGRASELASGRATSKSEPRNLDVAVEPPTPAETTKRSPEYLRGWIERLCERAEKGTGQVPASFLRSVLRGAPGEEPT